MYQADLDHLLGSWDGSDSDYYEESGPIALQSKFVEKGDGK